MRLKWKGPIIEGLKKRYESANATYDGGWPAYVITHNDYGKDQRWWEVQIGGRQIVASDAAKVASDLFPRELVWTLSNAKAYCQRTQDAAR